MSAEERAALVVRAFARGERDARHEDDARIMVDTIVAAILVAQQEGYDKGAREMRAQCADLARFNDPLSQLGDAMASIPVAAGRP